MDAEPLPEAIGRVLFQFEQWRERKAAREWIPERLWHAAVGAAQRHGVHAVVRPCMLLASGDDCFGGHCGVGGQPNAGDSGLHRSCIALSFRDSEGV